MTTSYVFTHNRERDECSVLHVGNHLVTDTHWRDGKWQNRVVQKFASVADAQVHVDGFIALRKRAGYRVREFEPTPDTIVLPPELSCKRLGKYLAWIDRPPGRFALVLHSKVSSEALAKMVDRIQKEKPSTIVADISSKRPPTERLSQAFIGKSLPTVRNLIISNIYHVDDSAFQHGDVGTLFVAMPELRRAFWNGDIGVRPFQHVALNELYLHGDPLRAAMVEALGGCSLPALQKLEIMLCDEMRSVCGDERCAIALSTLDAPRLEWLRVRGIEDITQFLERLLSRGLSSSLQTLRLEGEILDEDALLDVLERHADVLRKLGNLSLPLLDEVSLCAVDRVKELLPCYVDRSNESSWNSCKTYEDW